MEQNDREKNESIDAVIEIVNQMFGGIPNVFSNPCEEFVMGGNGNKCTLETKAKYDEDIRFSYYGCQAQCNHHKGVMVIATVVNRDKQVVHYGSAYCSPKDVYNKEKGKNISYLDLINNMKTVSLGKVSHHAINACILSDIVANDDAPSWCKDLLATELCVHLTNSFNVGGVYEK